MVYLKRAIEGILKSNILVVWMLEYQSRVSGFKPLGGPIVALNSLLVVALHP